MDLSNILSYSVFAVTGILFFVVAIWGIVDCFVADYEDWYNFDELDGKVVQLKTKYPVENEFTGWTCLVHVIDEDGKCHVYKTSTMLYRVLEEDKNYRFYIRDNAIWKVMELETRLSFKAKWYFRRIKRWAV